MEVLAQLCDLRQKECENNANVLMIFPSCHFLFLNKCYNQIIYLFNPKFMNTYFNENKFLKKLYQISVNRDELNTSIKERNHDNSLITLKRKVENHNLL